MLGPFPALEEARRNFKTSSRLEILSATVAGCPTKGPSCEVGTGNRKCQLPHLCLEPVGPDLWCLKPHSQQDHGKTTDKSQRQEVIVFLPPFL